jgi:hypothetical protein
LPLREGEASVAEITPEATKGSPSKEKSSKAKPSGTVVQVDFRKK